MRYQKKLVEVRRVDCGAQGWEQAVWTAGDSRMLDRFSKQVLFTAQRLFDGLPRPDRERTVCVLTTCTGPAESLETFYALVREGRENQISPTRFPNVMLSTALCRLTQWLDVHGPACVFWEKEGEGIGQAYVECQMASGICDAAVLIAAQEGGPSSGRLLVYRKDGETEK